MIELDDEEIQGLIDVGEEKDMREINAHTTNKLMEKELIGYGRGFLFLTKEGKKLFKKYKDN